MACNSNLRVGRKLGTAGLLKKSIIFLSSGFSQHTFSHEITKNFILHNVKSPLYQQALNIEAKLYKK